MSSIAPASRPSVHNQSDPSTASSSEFLSVTTHSPPPLTAPKLSTFSPAQTIALSPPSVTPTSPSAKPTSPSGKSISPAVVTASTLSPSPSPSVAQYPFPSKPSKKIPSPNPSSSSSAQVQPSSPRGPITTPPAGLPSPSPNPNINSTYPPYKIPGSLAPSSGPSNVKHPNKIPPQAFPIGQFSPPPKFSAPASSNFRPSSPFVFPASKPSLEAVPKRTKSSDDVFSPLGNAIIVAIGVLMIILAVVSFVIWYAMKKRKVQQGDNYLGPSLGSFCYETDRLDGTQSRTRSEFSPSSGQSSIRHSSAPQPFPVQGYENGCKSYNTSIARDMPGTVRSMNDTSRHGWGYLRSMFTYDQLAVATNGFSRENLLGVGGFGYVYKGYLQDGQVVAVKQLKVGGGQGEREFQAEVEIISRVHHRHLVSLVGYSIAGSQRLLVYDYVPNGNLEQYLHGSQRDVLDWATRIKIAVGAARGLAYLHEDCHPQIIHRDIKSSNILLDNNFEARVSDFGLAKLATDTDTHMTTRVVGTFGYLAPEYASSGKLTERSDVYSFGVLLLELVTGRRPVDTSQPVGSESLVEWVRPLLYRVLEYGNFEELADPNLENFDRDKMFCILRVAAACICHSAQRRPRMGQVVRALEDNAGDCDLSNGVQPGHSVDYDCPEHFALARTFHMMVFGHQEYGSNYSSEYGLHLSVPSSELQRSNDREGRASRYTRTDSHSPLFGPCDEHKTNGALETHVVNRPRSFMDDNW